MACRLQGAEELIKDLKESGYEAKSSPCLGQCERGPAVLIQRIKGKDLAVVAESPKPLTVKNIDKALKENASSEQVTIPQRGTDSLSLLARVGVVNPKSIKEYQEKNGSMYVGALYAGWAGYKFTTLGHFTHVTLCILIGMLVGAAWMLLPALLRVYAGVSEIISTIILNFVAVLFVSYMANGPFRADPIAPATPRILETAELKQIFPNSQFNTGFFIAVFVAILAHFVLNKTTFGYELRSGGDGLVGMYPSRFSSYLGIPSDRSAIIGMLISGALGGLAGAIEVLGAVRYFFQELEFNQGFDGILIGSRNGFAIAIKLNSGSKYLPTPSKVDSALNIKINSIGILKGFPKASSDRSPDSFSMIWESNGGVRASFNMILINLLTGPISMFCSNKPAI